MTLAYACILIAALLPYVWTMVAKSSAPKFDNREPRLWLEKQENPKVRRADAAQKNAFEAFPAFAAAVLMAQFANVAPATIGLLAVGFVVFRVLHGVFYVGNQAMLRSVAWFGGFMCMATLMALALMLIA